jgi:hypothetical protein
VPKRDRVKGAGKKGDACHAAKLQIYLMPTSSVRFPASK